MKQGSLAVVALLTLFCTAACTHKTPVAAARPPATTPVEQAPPASKPAKPKPSPTPPAEARSVVQTPPRTTMTKEERVRLETLLARMEDALFDYDKSTVRDDARSALRDDVAVIRDILANYPSQKLLVEGHCDERGSEEYNLALGDRRAHAAEEFLTSMGIPSAQLTLISFGKDRPVCTGNTEACWQKNRRAHLTAAP